MNYKLFFTLFLISICSFGQDNIEFIKIENNSYHLWGNTDIYIESSNAIFKSEDNTKKDKVFVEIGMNLQENKDYKKIKYIEEKDFKEITDQLLTLTSVNLFPNLVCLDGFRTTLKFGNDNNSVEYIVSCTKNNTNFHEVLKFILEKINLKEKDFYR